MGFIKNTSDEMKVYLTELGRQKLLDQGFDPKSFTISDHDVNYVPNQMAGQIVTDLTGDYVDNVYSIAKNIKIKNFIIR